MHHSNSRLAASSAKMRTRGTKTVKGIAKVPRLANKSTTAKGRKGNAIKAYMPEPSDNSGDDIDDTPYKEPPKKRVKREKVTPLGDTIDAASVSGITDATLTADPIDPPLSTAHPYATRGSKPQNNTTAVTNS